MNAWYSVWSCRAICCIGTEEYALTQRFAGWFFHLVSFNEISA